MNTIYWCVPYDWFVPDFWSTIEEYNIIILRTPIDVKLGCEQLIGRKWVEGDMIIHCGKIDIRTDNLLQIWLHAPPWTRERVRFFHPRGKGFNFTKSEQERMMRRR